MLDELNRSPVFSALEWHYVKFVPATRDQIPDRPGVYFFAVHLKAANIEKHYMILYFGKAKRSLQKRFGEYLYERNAGEKAGRNLVVKMLNIYKDRLQFAFCCIDEYEVERVEDTLLTAFNPPCNKILPPFKPAFQGDKDA